MQIAFTERALTDLELLRRYIAQDKPGAARKQVALILSAISLLADNPHLGRVGRVPDTYERVIGV